MAKLVDFADLSMIKVPERTETYIPVSHQELVTKIKEAGIDHYKRGIGHPFVAAVTGGIHEEPTPTPEEYEAQGLNRWGGTDMSI